MGGPCALNRSPKKVVYVFYFNKSAKQSPQTEAEGRGGHRVHGRKKGGRERKSEWAGPLQTRSLNRVTRTCIRVPKTATDLVAEWGKAAGPQKRSLKRARVWVPQDWSTGQGPGQRNGARQDSQKKRKAVRGSSSPPCLDSPIPSPGQHAERRKKFRVLIG